MIAKAHLWVIFNKNVYFTEYFGNYWAKVFLDRYSNMLNHSNSVIQFTFQWSKWVLSYLSPSNFNQNTVLCKAWKEERLIFSLVVLNICCTPVPLLLAAQLTSTDTRSQGPSKNSSCIKSFEKSPFWYNICRRSMVGPEI